MKSYADRGDSKAEGLSRVDNIVYSLVILLCGHMIFWLSSAHFNSSCGFYFTSEVDCFAHSFRWKLF